jgi:hypothetical protein
MVIFDQMFVFKKIKPIKVVSTACVVWIALSCVSGSVSIRNKIPFYFFLFRIKFNHLIWTSSRNCDVYTQKYNDSSAITSKHVLEPDLMMAALG